MFRRLLHRVKRAARRSNGLLSSLLHRQQPSAASQSSIPEEAFRPLTVFLTGATGFLGRHLVEALLGAGHQVVCTVRSANSSPQQRSNLRYVHADFTCDFDSARWLPRLQGVDVVINAVGILRERGRQTFDAIHVRAPSALFTACVAAGVRRVVQISALGADEHATSRYHLSKREADGFLTKLPIESQIIQPSLVYGPGGVSARLFTMLASLPWIPLPGHGEQMVQPAHIDDVVRAIVALVEMREAPRGRIPLVGPAPLRLRDFLACLRASMGLGNARFLSMPDAWVGFGARVGSLLPGSLLDTETLGMLTRGNVGDPEPITRLLNYSPRPPEEFIPPRDASVTRTFAKLQWLLPPLRWSIAAVWIVTGIVSLGVYPVEASYALLARAGVGPALAPVFLYGAAVMDLAIGLAILIVRSRRWLWLAQIAVILGYTIIVTLKLPEFWAHPYGPMLKNLPILVGIWLLYQLEPAVNAEPSGH